MRTQKHGIREDPKNSRWYEKNIKKCIENANLKSGIICKKLRARSKAQRLIHSQGKIITHDNR